MATYEVYLVVLSVVIGIVASYTALVAARVKQTQGRASNKRLTGGAIAMGTGIWFQLPISYDPWIVLVSMVVAIVATELCVVIWVLIEISPSVSAQRKHCERVKSGFAVW